MLASYFSELQSLSPCEYVISGIVALPLLLRYVKTDCFFVASIFLTLSVFLFFFVCGLSFNLHTPLHQCY